jgi:hypothetical protein
MIQGRVQRLSSGCEAIEIGTPLFFKIRLAIDDEILIKAFPLSFWATPVSMV